MHDSLLIEDLTLYCNVGIHEWEALTQQEGHIDLTIQTDTRDAAVSDEISDTVNYSEVISAITELVAGKSFRLIESMAEKIAKTVLKIDRVSVVTVRVSKPGASKIARNIAVEITRPDNAN